MNELQPIKSFLGSSILIFILLLRNGRVGHEVQALGPCSIFLVSSFSRDRISSPRGQQRKKEKEAELISSVCNFTYTIAR